MIIKSIIEQLPAATRPVVKIIKHSDSFKLIGIGLKQGLKWPDHLTTVPATLLVTQGKVIYREEGREIELQQYDNMDIPVNITHSLEASEDSICLLLQGQFAQI